MTSSIFAGFCKVALNIFFCDSICFFKAFLSPSLGREESQRRERIILIQSLCATGASQQAQVQSYQALSQQKLLSCSSAAPFANSQALVAQHQLMTSFDHLNPYAIHPRAQLSDIECVESGVSTMSFQENFHGFSAQQNGIPMVPESRNFNARQRPIIEHFELSSPAVSSPTQWNVQSPVQSGESAYDPTVSHNMYTHNEDTRHARRIFDSGDHALNSPSGALSPECHPIITPPTCAKILLPEFSQDLNSKKLFVGQESFKHVCNRMRVHFCCRCDQGRHS
jgi:hypothetical protein